MSLTLEELLAQYEAFHAKVEKTPEYMLQVDENNHMDAVWPTIDTEKSFWRQFHAACGMASESGEVLDLYKKRLFGKRKPMDMVKVLDEVGDVFWYFFLMLRATGFTFEQLLRYNTAKLSERYQTTNNLLPEGR